jgi:hypothetical protein
MTQINKIGVRHQVQYKVGEKVTCDLFPDQVFRIVSIQKGFAIVQGKSAVSRSIKLSRLHKA